RTNLPAGVMGRPSPAGSCWQKALKQRHKLIKRKPLAAARDFIGPPPRSLKIILSTSFNAALNLHAKDFKEKLFRNLYKIAPVCWAGSLATHLTPDASTS